jgi:hypothetical protein
VATISWKYNTDGNWANAAAWSGGVLPGAADTVVLNTLSYHTITFGSITATIGALSAITDSLLVASGSLSILGAASFGQNLTTTGGTLSLGTSSSVTGTFAGTSGAVALAAGTTLTLNASTFDTTAYGVTGAELDGAATLSTLGTTTISPTAYSAYTAMILGGGISWKIGATVIDGGQIVTGDAFGLTAALVNGAGNVFDLTTDVAGIINGRTQNPANQTVYGSSTFSNAGTLEKTGGTNTSYIDSLLTNTGVITAASGTLEFDGGGSFGGTLSGAGQIAFGAGTATISAGTGLTVANLLFDGATATLTALLSDPGTVTLTNGSLTLDAGLNSVAAFNQQGNGGNHLYLNGSTLTVGNAFLGTGYLEGLGTLTTSGTTTVAGTSVYYLGANANWVNTGTVNQTYYVYVDYGSGAGFSIVNKAGATYNITGDFSLGANNYNGTGSSFNNAGTFAKTGGAATSSIISTFTNTGTISAITGTTLEFDGGGTFAGTLTGAGTIAFASGSETFAAGLSLTASTILFDGGNVTLGSNLAFAAAQYVEVNGNVTLGSHTLSLTSAFLGGGSITGPGTVSVSGTTTISGNNGNGVLYLGGGVSLLNAGTINQTYYLYVNYPTGSGFSVTNKAGATYAITGDFNIGGNNYSGTGSTFANAGTFEKKAGTGTTQVISTFTNTGTVAALSGTLEFDGGGTLGGTLTGAGAIAVGSNTVTLAAGVVINATELVLDGGSITLGANLALTGATPLTIDGAPSAINLNGFNLTLLNADIGCGYVFGPGTLTTSGTTTLAGYNGYGFTETGISWINTGTINQNQTVYNDSLAGIAFTNSAGASYTIQGDFGYGYSNNAAGTFTNAGLFEKAAGTNTSSIYAVVNNTGTIDALSGTLDFESGGSFAGTLTGAGDINFASSTETLTATSITASYVSLGSGTLILGVNETIAGTFTENNGTLQLNGHSFTVANADFAYSYLEGGFLATSGTTTLANYSTVTIGGNLAWTNSGTVVEDYYVNVDTAGGAGFSVVNRAGAIWEMNGDQFYLGNNAYNGVTSSFNNAGTFTKLSGTNYDLVYSTFTNTGTVTVVSGEIAFEGGGTFAGVLNGSGLLSFQNNSYTLAGFATASTLSVEFYQSTLNLTANLSINGTLLANGSPSTINLGSNTLSVATLSLQHPGTVLYFEQAGTFTTSGTGTIVDWYNNGILLSVGGGATWANTGTLATAGVIQLGDNDLVGGNSGGTLTNSAGAVFAFTSDDAAIHQGIYYNAFGQGVASSAVIINAGTIEKIAGTGTSHIDGTLTSTGTLATTSGTLELDNGGGLSGLIADASTILLAAGTFTDGALTIGGGANVSNSTTILTTGALTLGDTGPGAATFTNTGLYEINAAVGIAAGGTSGGSVTNSGTLVGNAGTGRSLISVGVANSGTIIAQSGTLALTGTVAGTGALDIGAGATLELGANIAATQSIAFATSAGASTTGTLLLDAPASATETISGLTVADTIDLAGITATKALVNANDQLVVYNNTTIVATLQLAGSYLADTFTVTSDSHGGSDVTLSKVTTAWKGTAGDWYSANVWSNGPPNAQTNASVTLTGSYNLTLNSGETAAVATLALSAPQATYQFAGTLNVTQSVTMTAGSMSLTGTINGGIFALSTGATLTFNNAVLNNVAYQGTLDLSENYAYVSLLGTTSLAGANGHGAATINLTGYDTTLYADGYFTLNNATLNIGNGSYYADLRSNDTNGQGAILTLGTALAITHTGTYATLSDSGNAFDAVYNDGKIIAALATGTFTVTGNDFENDGSIAVSNGDFFSIQSAQFVNTGTLTVSHGTLAITGSLTDVGSLTATGSVLDIGGYITGTELTKISAGGTDTLNLSGTLNEAGGTLSVGTGAKITALTLSGTIENAVIKPTAGAFTFSNGATLNNDTYQGTMTVGNGVAVTIDNTLTGAAIADAGGGILFGPGAEFNAVTYQGTLSLLPGNTLSVIGGITLQGAGGTGAGAISAAAGTTESVLYLLDTETLNNVTITSGTGGGPGALGLFLAPVVPAGGTLTLGATTTFHVLSNTTAGFFSDSPTSGLPLGNSIVNNGNITLDAGAIFLGSDGSLGGFTNAGTITLGAGTTWSPSQGTLTASTFTNAATGKISLGTTATLLTNGGGMTNAGSITLASGAQATIQGNFTETGHVTVAAGASFTIDGTTTLASVAGISGAGTLGLDGLLNLAGGTFDMAASGRITNLLIGPGGDLKGGTLLNDAGTVSFAGLSTLDTMTWEGPLNIGAGATVQIANGLTLESSTGGTPGVANLTGGGALDYFANTLLDNTTINSSSPSAGLGSPGLADLLEIGGTATSLTFGPNFVLNANAGAMELADAAATTAGGALINNGQINVTAGALWLDASFASFTNTSTITLADNTEFDPTPSETGSTSFANAATGVVALTSLDNFDISGSAVNAGNITEGAGSEISIGGSFSNSGVIGMSHGASLTVAGTLINTGMIYANGASSDFIEATPGAGTAFNAGTLTGGTWVTSASSTLTLEFGSALTADAADLVLRGTGSVLRSLGATIARVESTLATITAAGTLSIQQSRGYTTTLALADNGLLQLQGGTLTAGSLTVGTGATLNGYGKVATAISNTGTVEALGGTLTLAAAVTGAGILAIGASSELEIATANIETAKFLSSTSELRLDAPTSFTGTLSGFAAGDQILLASTTATAAVLSGSSLTVTLSGGSTETFHVAGNSSTVTLTTASDGQGDTLLTYPTSQVHKHSMPAAPMAFIAEKATNVGWASAHQPQATASLADLAHGIGGDFAAAGPSHVHAEPSFAYTEHAAAAALWAEPTHEFHHAHGLTAILGRL